MKTICFLFAAATLSVSAIANAAPTEVGFAGRIAIEAEDDLEPLTTVELRFRLFAGDAAVFDETHPDVAVEDGLVFAALGRIDPSGNPLDDSLFNGDKLSLEITVNGEVMEPRLEILSVPYATRAGRAEVAERLGDLSPDDIARVDHNHDADYLPAGGTLACSPSEKVVGFDGATGDVQCAADIDTDTTVQAAANGGLVRVGDQMSIANSAITSARVADNSLTASDLAPNSVGSSEIATNAVGPTEIAANAVGSSEIATNAVGALEIAANAVSTSEVLDNSLTSADLGPSSVSTSEIADDSIRRTDISGIEVRIRRRANGCSNPSNLDTVATCSTIACAPPFFRSCNGACNRTTPEVCPLTTVFFGLAPNAL